MWTDFTDLEIIELARSYGIADELLWTDKLRLANRREIENQLTLIEYEFVNGE